MRFPLLGPIGRRSGGFDHAIREQAQAEKIYGQPIPAQVCHRRQIQGGGAGSQGGLVSAKSREGDCAGAGEPGKKGEDMNINLYV